MSIEETRGKLIVVLKSNEMELVNNEKYERVSITLMNHALDPCLDKTNDKYFKV
jgi:nitrate reductase NapAB chaperone NapD